MLCKVLHFPPCTGGHQTDGTCIHSAGGNSWQNSGKPDSMMDMSCTMLVSLAVATLMCSQVMARVFRKEDTNDASSSSMVGQDAGGSLQQIPVRKEFPEGLNRCGMAMLCGSSIMSGIVGPVGWWEIASAALCHTPGMCTTWNL